VTGDRRIYDLYDVHIVPPDHGPQRPPVQPRTRLQEQLADLTAMARAGLIVLCYVALAVVVLLVLIKVAGWLR
jgi:hypothetical protein